MAVAPPCNFSKESFSPPFDILPLFLSILKNFSEIERLPPLMANERSSVDFLVEFLRWICPIPPRIPQTGYMTCGCTLFFPLCHSSWREVCFLLRTSLSFRTSLARGSVRAFEITFPFTVPVIQPPELDSQVPPGLTPFSVEVHEVRPKLLSWQDFPGVFLGGTNDPRKEFFQDSVQKISLKELMFARGPPEWTIMIPLDNLLCPSDDISQDPKRLLNLHYRYRSPPPL